MGLLKIKKLLPIKEHHYQNQKAIHKMGENLCQLFIKKKKELF
jgi:hypothetical protein